MSLVPVSVSRSICPGIVVTSQKDPFARYIGPSLGLSLKVGGWKGHKERRFRKCIDQPLGRNNWYDSKIVAGIEELRYIVRLPMHNEGEECNRWYHRV
ncbi:hypothetical protein GOODEAATRI_003650 [Goodea atripinnis]|uniref:Uncharacterized protein n=1 Tax=Goodea atripinnis TaxID=208336 RepID=A0ABV0MP18_9TELE